MTPKSGQDKTASQQETSRNIVPSNEEANAYGQTLVNPVQTELGKFINNKSLEDKIFSELKTFSQQDLMDIKEISPYIYDNFLKNEEALANFLEQPRSNQAIVCRILETKAKKNNPLQALMVLNSPHLKDSQLVSEKNPREILLKTVLDSMNLKLDEDLPITKKTDYISDFHEFGNKYGEIKRTGAETWVLKIPDSVQQVSVNGKKYKNGDEVTLKQGDTYCFNSNEDKQNYVFQLVSSTEKTDQYGLFKVAEGKSSLVYKMLFPQGVNNISCNQKNIGSCLKLAAMINNLVVDKTGLGLRSVMSGFSYERDKQTNEIAFTYNNEKLSKPLTITPDDYCKQNNNLVLKDYISLNSDLKLNF